MPNDPQPTDRTRVVRWQDPAILVTLAAEHDGLAALHEMLAQNYQTPISALLDFDLVHAEAGLVRFAARTHESQFNPMGTIHGGVIATWLDSALAAAVYSTLPRGTGCTVAQLNIHYVRPLVLGTPGLIAEGEVVRTGRQMATAQAKLVDGEGRLYAHGSATCLIL